MLEMATILEHKEVLPNHYMLVLHSPKVAETAKPGQFVHIKLNETLTPILRRPISLNGIDKNAGTITLLYHVVGEGTKLLTKKHKGVKLDIMGPIGNGFSFPKDVKNVAVIAGGIGVAPVFPLIEELIRLGVKVTLYYGSRSKDNVIKTNHLINQGAHISVATDDGTLGYNGFVTDLLAKDLENGASFDYYYTCGPLPMMKGVAKIMEGHEIPGELSLEERMGCGTGACLACVCKIKVKSRLEAFVNDSFFTYKKVCVDGPVFSSEEVYLYD